MPVVVLVDKQLVYGDPHELEDMHLGAIRDELQRLHDDIERLTDALKAADAMLTALMKDVGVTKKEEAAHRRVTKQEDAARLAAPQASPPARGLHRG